LNETLAASTDVNRRKRRRSPLAPVAQRRGERWEKVAAAHAISLVHAGGPERAIGAAAGSGGDTDTVACIVCAIVGARYGYAALPERWAKTMPAPSRRLCDDAATALVIATA